MDATLLLALGMVWLAGALATPFLVKLVRSPKYIGAPDVMVGLVSLGLLFGGAYLAGLFTVATPTP